MPRRGQTSAPKYTPAASSEDELSSLESFQSRPVSNSGAATPATSVRSTSKSVSEVKQTAVTPAGTTRSKRKAAVLASSSSSKYFANQEHESDSDNLDAKPIKKPRLQHDQDGQDDSDNATFAEVEQIQVVQSAEQSAEEAVPPQNVLKAIAARVAADLIAKQKVSIPIINKKIAALPKKLSAKAKGKARAAESPKDSDNESSFDGSQAAEEDQDSSELSEADSEQSEAEEDNGGGFIRTSTQNTTVKRRRVVKPRIQKHKLTWWEKNELALQTFHPELANVWIDLKTNAVIVPEEANQPEGLKLTLLPFQKEGLFWMKKQEVSHWAGGMLADEMGMGKTIQTIALILSDREPGKIKNTLVLAPTVAIMQWRNEFEKFTENFKVCVWHGGNRVQDKKALEEFDVVLTSYAVLESSFRRQNSGFKRKGQLMKEDSILHAIKWHRIILDEAHNIKDRSCNTARGAFALKATYRWCLSGTPLQNRVGELYSLIRFIGVDPFAHYFCKKCDCKSLHWAFSNKRHCDKCGHTPMHHICYWNNEILKPIQKYGASNGSHGAAAFEKLSLLLGRLMLRRTKVERADDLGLPPRVLTVRQDYFTEEEEEMYASLYTDVKRKFSTYADAGTILNNYANVFQLLTRMRQTACHPDLVLKGAAAKALLGESAEGKEQESLATCRLCLDEAEQPVMSKCKHVYCRECVRQYLETATVGEPECPVCHVPMTIDLDEISEASVAAITARQGMLNKIDPGKWRTSTKIEALVEELSKLRTEEHSIKSLVFSQFTSFLDLVARRLQLAGFKIARLQGNMTPEARDRTVKYFMETTDCTVFLLSLKAGGVALNLVEASRVYLMDPWWNPSAEMQAVDRIHRIGQKRPVIVKRFIIQNSIEAKIVELQKKKEAMIGAALGDDDAALGRLTPEDLRFLFVL